MVVIGTAECTGIRVSRVDSFFLRIVSKPESFACLPAKKKKKERKKKKNAISWLPWKRREEGRRILSRGLCIIYPSVFFEHRCKDFYPRVKIFQLNIWNIFYRFFLFLSLTLFFKEINRRNIIENEYENFNCLLE